MIRATLSLLLAFFILTLSSIAQCTSSWTCNSAATQQTPTSVIITWNSSIPATSRVRYGTTTAYGKTSVNNTTPVSSHSVTITGLTTGILYYYSVVGIDSQNIQVFGTQQTFTLTNPVAHNVGLTWNASTSTVSGYNMYRSLDQTNWTLLNTTGLITTLDYTDNSVTSGTTYYYGVTAVDANSNESIKSNIATAVIP